MSRLSRVGLIALALSAASAVGCGSDSAKPPAAGSGGSSGKTDAGSTGGVDVGDGGSSSGGAEGIDSGPPPDTTPPTFAGVKAVEAKGEDAVVVSWDAATDPPNGDAKIAYVVYRAATQGGEDYTRAHRCGDPSIDAGTADVSHVPCFASTGSGETSITLRGVVPGTEYFYVVRAIDASGNEDDNTKEASATTADETKPDFAGVRSVTVVSATSVNVTWGAGYDVGTPDPELVFKVYAKEDVTPDPATDTPVYTSKPGERSTIVGGLTPRGFYKVVVHATDQAGHSDDNGRVLGITMPEGDPPAFDGIRGATGEGDTTIRLFWTPAKDNQTPDASIVYDVFMSTVSHGEKFDKPPFATSTPGAASILLTTGLQQGSKYYFVVRARDYVGNRDSNTVEKGVTTSTPDVTKPTFGGVTGVTGTSPTALKVTWDPANDDRTLFATDFTYRVYASTSATVPTTTPYVIVKGVNSATLVGLSPGTSYNVVVVAVDLAGNQSDAGSPLNGSTLAAIPGDTVPPTFTSPITLTPVISPASTMNVSWSAGTDDTAAANQIRYHVCASPVDTDCRGAKFSSHVLATTNPGVTTASLTALKTHTSYFVFVRAEDPSGNLSTADTFAQKQTATSWGNDVKQILFDRCGACHKYDSPALIVNIGASYADISGAACNYVDAGTNGCQMKLIAPGKPQFSYIYRRINQPNLATPPFSATVKNFYSGVREPRDTTTPLSVDENEIIGSWIQQGALGN